MDGTGDLGMTTMKSNDILIITGRKTEGSEISQALQSRSFTVTAASTFEEARKLLLRDQFAAVITDWEVPGAGGSRLLSEIGRLCPEGGVIVVLAQCSTETVVEALRAGAYDCLAWPMDEHRMVISLMNLLEKNRLLRESDELRKHLKEKYKFSNIIGSSSRMREVYRLTAHLLPSKTTVLIRGESGTGKELIAEAIHFNGPRAHRPLIKVHCSALTETLLESELFGHEKGAFTGAVQQKIGRFEMADGGTLFLDEIGDISPVVQIKLLRVLEEERFERVGGTKSIKVDIRIITATGRNLEEAVRQGTFREDLYYRLNVVPIVLPPLRERTEDIPILVEHFLKKYNQANGKKVTGVDQSVLKLFMNYRWPGNVRELEHAVEHAIVLSNGPVITRALLPLQLQAVETEKPAAGAAPGTLVDMEKEFIAAALRRNRGKRSATARELRIDRSTLYQKIKRYKLLLPKDGGNS